MANNVQGRIDDYLDQVFGPYEDSPTVADLRLEIRHDLLERLDDLTAHGVGDEVAYAQVVSSVGEIDATLRQLAAQDRADEATTSEPNGPAHTIPVGDAPGAQWRPTAAPTAAPEQPGGFVWNSEEGWMATIAGIADAVNSALDSARARARKREPRSSFANSNLRRANLSGQDLSNSSFAASSMREANLSGCKLVNCSFSASDLRGATFDQADLSGANLASCSLRNARFTRAKLINVSLATANLRGASFVGATIQGSRLKFADLREARFNDCLIENVDFSGSDLRQANFDGIVLDKVRFNMANLSEASFRGATIRNATFNHVSRQSVMSVFFEDTVVDQATYLALCATGCSPTGLRVEN